MKAYLINPEQQNITEVEYSGNYEDIYKLIGAEMFDVVRLNREGDGIFVDDVGLMKRQRFFFRHSGYHNWLAGKGLVLGCDDSGESCEPSISIEQLRQSISFGINLMEA